MRRRDLGFSPALKYSGSRGYMIFGQDEAKTSDRNFQAAALPALRGRATVAALKATDFGTVASTLISCGIAVGGGTLIALAGYPLLWLLALGGAFNAAVTLLRYWREPATAVRVICKISTPGGGEFTLGLVSNGKQREWMYSENLPASVIYEVLPSFPEQLVLAWLEARYEPLQAVLATNELYAAVEAWAKAS